MRGDATGFFATMFVFSFYKCSKVRVPIEAINCFINVSLSGLLRWRGSVCVGGRRNIAKARGDRAARAAQRGRTDWLSRGVSFALSASGEECAHACAAAPDRCKAALRKLGRRECGTYTARPKHP